MWGDLWGAMVWGDALLVPLPLMSPTGLVLLVTGLLTIGVVMQRRHAPQWAMWTLGAVVLVIPLAAYAGTVAIPHTFTNGTVADAGEVNENFDTLVTESNAQDVRITAVEAGGGGSPTGPAGGDLAGTYPNPSIAPATIFDSDISASAAIQVSKLQNLPTSRALVSDFLGDISASPTTAAEVAFIAGLVSSAQTQIDGKVEKAGDTMTGDLLLSGATTDLTVDGLSTLAAVDVDAGAIDGTTIGATSPSAGTFSTAAVVGTTTLNGALTVNGTGGDVPHDCTLQTQSFPTSTNFSMFCGTGKLSLGGGGVCLGGTLISAPYVAGSGSGWRLTCATVHASNEVIAWCCDL